MPDPAAELRALVAEFYPVWFRYHPDKALALGQPAPGPLLPPQDDDERGALSSWLETLILGLDELDLAALDPTCRQDVQLLAGAARVEHRELAEVHWRPGDPLRCLPLESLYALTLQPGEDLRPRLAGLLAAIPEHLRHAQALLHDQAPRLARPLVQSAIREAECGRRYLHELTRGPWLRQHCHGLPEIEALIDRARSALADYGELLRTEVAPCAEGTLARGRGPLAERLRGFHFLAVDLDTCRGALARALDRVETALAALPVALEPSTQGRLEAGLFRDRICDRIRDEIAAAGLVTLPEAPLVVHPAPARPETWRGRIDYRPNDTGGALFIPTPDFAGNPEPAQALAGCLERGWGGSHLLHWAAPARACRLPRRLANDVSLRVGLASFLESRIAERAGAARQRLALVRLRERLRLGLMDLDLHAGEPGGAPGPPPHPATEDGSTSLAALVSAPGDGAAAALGCLLVEKACRLFRGRSGTGPRALLDGLVCHGPVPLGLAVSAEHGDDLWSRLIQETLDG
jgi:hypothetical protein